MRGARLSDVTTFLEAGLLETAQSVPEFHAHIDLLEGAPLRAPQHLRTPVYLESHGRPREWDAVWSAGNEDIGKRRSTSKAPFALVQHYAPRLNSEAMFSSMRESNYIRILGVFESAPVAHALVDAITCPVRNNFAQKLQTQKWQKFCGWDTLNLAKPFHFILLCHDQPVEVYTLDISELPNHGPAPGSMAGSYPPGCKVSQQEYGVVRFRPWWPRIAHEYNNKRLSPELVDMYSKNSERIIAELKAVQEIHACVGTRNLANEHALDILYRLSKDSDTCDSGDTLRAHTNLMAVVKLYEWLELPSDGGNDVLWQDMRLRRFVESRREKKDRHQPPQRRPERDETSAQVHKRQLYETLQKIRQGKFEVKQEAILAHKNSNSQQSDERASLIEARLNRLRTHVANTNADLQDLNKMDIISGSSGRVCLPAALYVSNANSRS